MDRANLALAEYLRSSGHEVLLVGHDFDDELSGEFVRKQVPRYLGSTALGERGLAHVGRRQAELLVGENPHARVVVNGANCGFGDINWVHYVHNAYPANDGDAPLWVRWKERALRRMYRRREGRALRAARLVIANSQAAARQVIAAVGVPESRVKVVYPGCAPELRPASEQEKASAREWLQVSPADRVIAFVGALTWDDNKGLETVWRAWQNISRDKRQRYVLVVAGGGAKLKSWRERVAASDAGDAVRVLGFTERVNEVLAAADVLVSPSRYETFGLNVQEAICRGVPAIASATSGIAELYPKEMQPLLLKDCEDSEALAEVIESCFQSLAAWNQRTRSFADQLRSYTWDDMARQIVEIAAKQNA